MKLKRLLLLTLFVPFLFPVTTTHAQEKEADFEDGTVLYYTMLDTTVNQMHQIHLNVGSELSLAYFRPDKNFFAEADWDFLYDSKGVNGNYFFATKSKVKKVKGGAKMVSTGVNTATVYAIHMQTERKVFYGVHGGVYYMNPNAPGYITGNSTPLSSIPEIALGVCRFNAWGIKYMIRDPDNKRRSIRTFIGQRVGFMNLDILIFPSKPTGGDSTFKYHTIGERFYMKGYMPIGAHRDFGIYGLAGIENSEANIPQSGTIHFIVGFGLCGGWK